MVDPNGKVVVDDGDGKTTGILPGRMTMRLMREAVQGFVILMLRRKEPFITFPLENVVWREPEEIDRMLAWIRPDLKELR